VAFAPLLTECSAAQPKQVIYKGTAAMLVNRDSYNTVILGGDEGITSSNVVQILDPLGTAGFDGSEDVWALAISGTPVVQTVPGGTSQQVTVVQSANLFGAFSQILAHGTTTFGPLPVANWTSLVINIRVTGSGGLQCNVHHWADAAATELIGGDSWPVRTATKLSVITPLRGPYVSIDLTVTSAGTLAAVTYCAFQAAPSPQIRFPVGAQTAGANNRTLAVSGSDFWNLPSICAGRASFKFIPYDTAGKLVARVEAVDELGNFQYYPADFGTPTAPFNTLMEIPDVPCVVAITNNDGAATHTYDVELIVPPQ
jgi:hypothetical protein